MRSRNYLVDMIVERTGGRPITVALPSLVDGEVAIDEAGSVYLVDEVVRWRRIAGAPPDHTPAGDGGWAVDDQPGQAQVRNGRLELPHTQQRPGIPRLKSHN
jgi:hypothetical protein